MDWCQDSRRAEPLGRACFGEQTFVLQVVGDAGAVTEDLLLHIGVMHG
jgi:hypothetical protein